MIICQKNEQKMTLGKHILEILECYVKAVALSLKGHDKSLRNNVIIIIGSDHSGNLPGNVLQRNKD